jgi:hypothetical protein
MKNKSNFKSIIKSVNIKPNKHNSFVWFNILFVIALLITGRVDAKGLVFAYFFETIIIGIFHVFKLYKVYKYTKRQGTIKRKEDGFFAPFFFSLHYGFFIVVQLIFVFVALEFMNAKIVPFHLIENFTWILTTSKGIWLVLGSLFISNLLDLIVNYIQNKTYEKVSMEQIFFQPYGRIMIQQLAVIISGFFTIFSFGIVIIAIALVGLKAFTDFLLISYPNAIKEIMGLKKNDSIY